MDKQLLKQIGEDVLNEPLEIKGVNDDICGIYVDGTGKLTFEAADPAFHAFRVFSQWLYPIYLFVSEENDINEIKKLEKKYYDVRVRYIKPLRTSFEYNEWMFNIPWYLIGNHRYVFTFQDDGYCIKPGWEWYCLNNEFDFIGAPWRSFNQVITSFESLPPVKIGNGGCSWRNLNKTKQVIDFVNSWGGQHKFFKSLLIDNQIAQTNSWLCEDIMFTAPGFHYKFFKPVSIEQAAQFSLEPITMKLFLDKDNPNRPYCFHKIDKYE